MSRKPLATLRRLLKRRDGATALEFALIAPVLIAIIFAASNFGILLWTWIALYNTATETARCQAVLNCHVLNASTGLAAQNYATNVAKGLGVSVGTVTAGNSASACYDQTGATSTNATDTCYWVVTINKTSSLFIPGGATLGGPNVGLNATYTINVVAYYPDMSSSTLVGFWTPSVP